MNFLSAGAGPAEVVEALPGEEDLEEEAETEDLKEEGAEAEVEAEAKGLEEEGAEVLEDESFSLRTVCS